jgi:capsid protein
MSAHEKAIALGLKSRSEIIREQGRDPDDVWREIQAENEKMAEMGINQEPAQAGFLMDDEDEDDED